MPVSQMAKTLTQDINKRNQLQTSFVELSNHCKMNTSPSAPIISIVVPIYNRARFLSGCLDSILAQTFKEWECILVNDGSTDNSLEIAENYAANDPRFLVISQENQGVSAARNLGIDHAQGKWLTFVDSDDEIAPDYLEILHKIAEDNNADLVNGSMVMQFNENVTIPKKLHDITYSKTEEDFAHQFNDRMVGIIKLYRLSIIKRNNIYFNTTFHFAEDFIFTLDFYQHAQRFAASSKAIYFYNNREEITNQLHTKLYSFQNELKLYNKIQQYIIQFSSNSSQDTAQIQIALGLCLHINRVLQAIEKQTNSFFQRYKMYRLFKIKIPIEIASKRTQKLRYYLLYKQQYFLFALSRIWVNRH